MTAPVADAGPAPWAGIWIAEDIEMIAAGVRSGNWVENTLGVAGGGLDALALAVDPVGVLLQYGIAWLLEHVEPLAEALDWLAGDPGEIAAHAQTWRNVAASLGSEAEGLERAVRWDTTEWAGAAGDAYRAWASGRGQTLAALGQAAEAMAAMTEGAGVLIGTVRLMVRDAVAVVVSRLVVYAGELLATGGLAAPVVVGQVGALCASWGARIAGWLRDLIASLRRLVSEGDRLTRLIDKLKRLLHGRGSGVPEAPREPNKKIGAPTDFDPDELRGLTADDVKARIPADWVARPSRAGGGSVYGDPHNRGRQVRIMPGYPPGSRPEPVTWGPYAEVCQNGVALKIPLAGNPTL
ncbi:WXG100 family type VII secretion target [Paractinoplanes rishiriensis]|uniref:Outer membrane channel protein CpnT-like N-terminal domain-containing protein n=1 Tax=Paractinoplanes rishiriensis TaxID=1050105 RepID=A0A919JY16_9ACTN|nr:hypothetical protein [Actinoplanes rishiriensis]GIE95759.1 hypothetical protein Ari01nite_32240 [Actinoplanes rishiriensis]